ncbi:MAG: hypothetical protein D6705_12390 [Deltaproteobacteria bacterium]|nr:MAG: hypothetical protein D6705_12390 [Deltaproteobacteria bacterium]
MDGSFLPAGRWPRRFAALALGLAGCTSAHRGGPGESCLRRADCRDGLGCFDGVCRTAAPSPEAQEGPADALGTPRDEADRGRTPQGRKDAAQAPARVPPKDDAPAPAAFDTSDLRVRSIPLEGPLEDVTSYCRKRYAQFSVCGPWKGKGKHPLAILGGQGRVEIVQVGDEQGYVGFAFRLPWGTYAAFEVHTDGAGAGGELAVFVEAVDVTESPPDVEIVFRGTKHETVWTKEDAPRAEQPSRTSTFEDRATCRIATHKAPVCNKLGTWADD